MRPDDFGSYFEQIHGCTPFPWQKRLARLACEEDWPSVLALPTASGKTSAIDIALFSLAYQADRPPRERTARMRTVFVVDRRIVVDEAAEHSRKVAAAIASANHPVLAEVRDRLRSLSAGDEPVAVALLRGGLHRDERWARSPAQPTVVVSTVDQVGSRLLFRGYGIPARSRSIHAGLLGIDARILLDEAHLSAPFEDTVAYLARVQDNAPRCADLPPRLALTTLTATPRTPGAFALTPEDLAHAELTRRLDASKPTVFRATTDIVDSATTQALAWSAEGHVVGVVVNRVATAREVYARIARALPADRRLLLTGRMRPIDRDELLVALKPRIAAARDRSPAGPFVVVATQTIEVGANVDFDRVVSELAPLDALRQRFGRLNRMGNHSDPTPAVVMARRADIAGRDAGKDPVYGNRSLAMWNWVAKVGAPIGDGWSLDLGVNALDRALAGTERTALTTVPPRCPAVMPSHLDAWVQTHPAPIPDPPVAPYLHGPEALDLADVQVVWRADLDAKHPETWGSIAAAVPPVSAEALPLPIREVVRWLEGRSGSDLHDLPTEVVPESAERGAPPKILPTLRWGGPDEAEVIWDPREIRGGDTLVVPSTYGGIDRESANWSPSSKSSVPDRGDQAAANAGRAIRRLHPEFSEDPGAVEDLYRQLVSPDRERPAREITAELAKLFNLKDGYRLTPYCPAPRADGEEDGPVYLLAWRRKGDDEFADDGDSASIARVVGLEEHSLDVERWARRFAMAARPADELVTLLARAGWWHDVGKADRRMQAWLAEGVPDPGAMLAKSAIPWRDRRRNRAAREASGYPRGARHELQSVALLLARPDATLDVVDPELLVHLVGTHHGFGRGLPPVVVDPDPVLVELDHGGVVLSASSAHGLARLDSGWTERFQYLNEAYGPWGLAWLEAVLRLADHAASEEEAKGGDA